MAEEYLNVDSGQYDTEEEAEEAVAEKKEIYLEKAGEPYKSRGELHGRMFEVDVTTDEETGAQNQKIKTIEIKRETDVEGEIYRAVIRLEEIL